MASSSSLSPLRSSTPLYPLSPSHISSSDTNTNLTPSEVRLNTSINMVKDQHPTEHNVARYAMLFLMKFFLLDIWNFVPQYYSQSGKWPGRDHRH